MPLLYNPLPQASIQLSTQTTLLHDRTMKAKKIISAVRSKTDAVKARVLVTALTFLSKKRTISAKINHAIDGIFNHHQQQQQQQQLEHCSSRDDDLAMVLYSNDKTQVQEEHSSYYHDDDSKYPDLRHTMFDDEDNDKEIADLLDDPNASVSAIDIVKNQKEDGEKFNLEDEIDEVADMFITKFHKRMRLQKLLSFKRHKQMLAGES